MQWKDLHDTVTVSYLHGQWPVPQIVILHLSGNDCNTLGLLAQIKLDLLCLHVVLPDTIFIFSKIVPCLHCLHCCPWSFNTVIRFANVSIGH